MNNILVTGGAGFVGRHLCKALLEDGHNVVCVDNIVPLTGGKDPIKDKWPLYNPCDYKNFTFIKQDCRDYFAQNPSEYYDYAFHLAAMVGGREMIELNPLAVAEDLEIDSAFWRWAKQSTPKKVVCFSSSAAYPIKYQRKENYKLLTEDLINFDSHDIGMPDMSYGWAKLTNEYLAKLAYNCHGIKSVTYRPFSGYGEDQDMAYPFPSICQRALLNKNQETFTVWGTGDQMRDFIHIDDCIDGILTTMNKIDDASAVNLSTGILTSFKEFAKIATDIVGYSPVIKGTSAKPEGVFARGGSISLQNSLGFYAKTSFIEGVKRGIEYFNNNLIYE